MDREILLELRLAEAEDKNHKLREKIITDALKIIDLHTQLAKMQDWIDGNPQRKRAYELDSRN